MADYVWGDDETQFFFQLTPDLVLDSIDKLGYKTTGRVLTLNSLENRVYEIEIEIDNPQSVSDKFLVAKFYRPGRWSQEQIREEHQFLFDLEADDIPVVAPLKIDGKSLFQVEGHQLYYCVFPKKGGRIPDEFKEKDLTTLGIIIARMHIVGLRRKAIHRLELNPQTFGEKNLEFLLSNNFIPNHLTHSFETLSKELLNLINPLFKGVHNQRIHGDCHRGNILQRDGIHLIDFDDMCMGPCVQDIWLVTPGDDEYSLKERDILLDGYCTFKEFDYSSLKLVEPLRSLRYLHFSAWIAKRWSDPAFKNAFPHFERETYWEGQLHDLRIQISKINEINF